MIRNQMVFNNPVASCCGEPAQNCRCGKSKSQRPSPAPRSAPADDAPLEPATMNWNDTAREIIDPDEPLVAPVLNFGNKEKESAPPDDPDGPLAITSMEF